MKKLLLAVLLACSATAQAYSYFDPYMYWPMRMIYGPTYLFSTNAIQNNGYAKEIALKGIVYNRNGPYRIIVTRNNSTVICDTQVVAVIGGVQSTYNLSGDNFSPPCVDRTPPAGTLTYQAQIMPVAPGGWLFLASYSVGIVHAWL